MMIDGSSAPGVLRRGGVGRLHSRRWGDSRTRGGGGIAALAAVWDGRSRGGVGLSSQRRESPTLVPMHHVTPIELVSRPGMSGDSKPWEGWSHAREHVEEVPA